MFIRWGQKRFGGVQKGLLNGIQKSWLLNLVGIEQKDMSKGRVNCKHFNVTYKDSTRTSFIGNKQLR